MPKLQDSSRYEIKFTLREPDFLLTGISRYLVGCTRQTRRNQLELRWNTKRFTELTILGISINIAPLVYTPAPPQGSTRTIDYEVLNSHTMRIQYDGEQFLFTRVTPQEKTSTTLESWIILQLLGSIYSKLIHL